MRNTESILLGTTCFFAGMVAGFFLAPIKKGIFCGNHSGNTIRQDEIDQEEKREIDKFMEDDKE